MKLLLDTHMLLWAAFDAPRLNPKARALINDTDNTLYFSAISLWEIAIKRGLNRPDFSFDPRLLHYRLLVNGFLEIGMTSEHGMVAGQLPFLHSDPFDRALIAQARCEGLTLLTADRDIGLYDEGVLKV